jgi:hypothetical protein
MFQKGEIVTLNHQVGVVVLTGEELEGDLDDHTGVWFGTLEDSKPEVITIPTEYLAPGPRPILKH